jgi:hypothetical protein
MSEVQRTIHMWYRVSRKKAGGTSRSTSLSALDSPRAPRAGESHTTHHQQRINTARFANEDLSFDILCLCHDKALAMCIPRRASMEVSEMVECSFTYTDIAPRPHLNEKEHLS